MDSLHYLAGIAKDTFWDVLPILLLLAVFQWLILRQRLLHLRKVLIGFACMVGGLILFLAGLDMALFPIGRDMAHQLAAVSLAGSNEIDWRNFYPIYLFGMAIGFGAVMVEPAVIAVALRVNRLSAGAVPINALRITIALGVGVGIAIGCFRIVSGGSLFAFIAAAYAIVILQTIFAPRNMIPIAYDSGGVSTSTVTVPIVAALGLGLSASIPDRNPLVDGFGMIAFAVAFPIISVLAYAQIAAWFESRPTSHPSNPDQAGPHDALQTDHRTDSRRVE
jgi:hypothetical protein